MPSLSLPSVPTSIIPYMGPLVYIHFVFTVNLFTGSALFFRSPMTNGHAFLKFIFMILMHDVKQRPQCHIIMDSSICPQSYSYNICYGLITLTSIPSWLQKNVWRSMKISHCTSKLSTCPTSIVVGIIVRPHLKLPLSCLELVRNKWTDETSSLKLGVVISSAYLSCTVHTVPYDIHFYFQMVNRGGILIFCQMIIGIWLSVFYFHSPLLIYFKAICLYFTKRLLFLSSTSSFHRFF